MTRLIARPSFLLAASAAFVVLALVGFQTTGERASDRLLGRLVGAIVEIDRWLPGHRDDIQLQAQQKARGTIDIEGLPLPVNVRASEVIAARNGDLSTVLLDAAGHTLYQDGASSFRDGSGGGRLSVTEPARWLIALLGRDAHYVWTTLLGVGTILALAVIAAVALRDGHVRDLLWPLTVGSGLVTLVFVFVWVFTRAINVLFSEPVDREIVLIARDAAWIGVRDGLAITIATFVFFLLTSFIHIDRREWRWPGALDETP